METPSEGGSIQSWDDSAGTGVIALDAGGTATVARAAVTALNPGDARQWPSVQAASLLVGQRVLCKTAAGAAVLAVPDPNAVALDGTGELA